MGHIRADGAESGGQRTGEMIRRGRIREGRPRVQPSAWEHLEVSIGERLDRTHSLILEHGETFRATVQERRHDDAEECLVSVEMASGAWRPLRGGVELIFIAAPGMELADYEVTYLLRDGHLLADSFATLPDGLAQEYAPCDATVQAPSLLTMRALADAAALAAETQAGAVSVDNMEDDDLGIPVGVILEDDDGRSQTTLQTYGEDFEVPSEGSAAETASDDPVDPTTSANTVE